MAIRPDYDVGTVTLVASSANFTTSGSSLQTAAVQAGDAIVAPSGHVLIIASITGQNSGTLFLPCPAAAAGSGLPLRIRFQPDGSRYQGAVRNLIELLASGNLEAFAALVGANGMVPIFTGPGTLDLADPATFGIQDPNGSLGKLAALTLAARQILQTDETGALTALTLAARQILQTDATGALKAVALAANKALVTDANGDVAPINIGTLGRALLALATGTTAQYVQGDGTLQAKSGLPISNATQTALNGKQDSLGFTPINKAGDSQISGNLQFNKNVAEIRMNSPGNAYGWRLVSNVTDTANAGFEIRNADSPQVVVNPTGTNIAGNCNVFGALSKGSGTFLTDHPLDPFNRNLRHGFVEAPRYDLIYRGTVQLINGRAAVDIDAASNMTSGTFSALTTNAVVTSLQNQDGFARLKPGPIDGGAFEIICEDAACTDLVSWIVIAERDDPFVKSSLDPNTDSDGRFVPEFDKDEFEEMKDD